jgi:hypothetical protein
LRISPRIPVLVLKITKRMTGDVSRFINEKSYYLFVLFADETINMPPSDYEVNPTLAL